MQILSAYSESTAGIKLDFNPQCIYTISGWVTVIVKFVPQVAQVAQVEKIHVAK